MRLSLITLFSLLVYSNSFAQPSNESVIKRIQLADRMVYKVECSDRKDKELDGAILSLYATKSYTYAQGNTISKVKEEIQVYEGFEHKETQYVDAYYIGIPDPDMEGVTTVLDEIAGQITSDDYANVVNKLPEFKTLTYSQLKWKSFNALTVPIEAKYAVKRMDKPVVEDVHLLANVTLFRSVDGISWDPNANILKDGKWITNENIVEIEILERKVLASFELSQEQFDTLIPAKDAWRYPEKFSSGDRVEGKFEGRWFLGKVVMQDEEDPNRYYIFFDDGDKLWFTKDQLRLGEKP